MGSSTSKAARTAPSLTRKFPSHATPPPHPSSRQPQSKNPQSAPRSQEGAPLASPLQPQFQQSPPQPQSSRPPPHPQDDIKDPALSARLSQLGPVTPAATHSNSSTFTPSSSSSRPADPLSQSSFPPSAFSSSSTQPIFPSTAATSPSHLLLAARTSLAAAADAEMAQIGRPGFQRSVVDVGTIRQILRMRDELGWDGERIEDGLGLRKGIVGRLGRREVFGVGVGGE